MDIFSFGRQNEYEKKASQSVKLELRICVCISVGVNQKGDKAVMW